jgi:2-hydroxy-6-oxonona-2,4-dienedioate hydrolase
MSALTVIALLAIAAGGAVYWFYSAETRRARAAVEGGARFAATSAGPIEYADKGTGAPLLSIHGAGGGYDQGLANVADLVGDSFRVIAPSRFGYLGTPVPADVRPSAQADAHAALLDALAIEKAVVVGVSAGARSALQLALRHPRRVTALIIIVPGTFAPETPVAIEQSRGSEFVFWLVNAGADFAWWATGKIAPSVLIRFVGVPPEVVAAASAGEQRRVMEIIRSIQPLSWRFRGINIDSIPDVRPAALDGVRAPTLVISARDDLFRTLPAAEFAASGIPGARLVVCETGGHLLVGRQGDVRSAVATFLGGTGSTAVPA